MPHSNEVEQWDSPCVSQPQTSGKAPYSLLPKKLNHYQAGRLRNVKTHTELEELPIRLPTISTPIPVIPAG